MKTIKGTLIAALMLASTCALAGGGGGGGVLSAFAQLPQSSQMVLTTEISADRLKFHVATWDSGNWRLSELVVEPGDVQSELLAYALQKSASTRAWQRVLPPQ